MFSKLIFPYTHKPTTAQPKVKHDDDRRHNCSKRSMENVDDVLLARKTVLSMQGLSRAIE